MGNYNTEVFYQYEGGVDRLEVPNSKLVKPESYKDYCKRIKIICNDSKLERTLNLNKQEVKQHGTK